jgi:two-component system response regulator HydG
MPRILLVEDDADTRLVMQHTLIDGGHEVDATETVLGGRELIRDRAYDLLVADGRMPDGTGMEVADQAREKGVPVLIVTGYAFELPKDDLNRFEFLLKPVRSKELLQAVERALQTENT